jgi:hypothetical protein
MLTVSLSHRPIELKPVLCVMFMSCKVETLRVPLHLPRASFSFNTVISLRLVRTTVVEPTDEACIYVYERYGCWKDEVGDEYSAFHHFDLICVSTHWGRFLLHELVSKDFPQCRTRAIPAYLPVCDFFWGRGRETVQAPKVLTGVNARVLRGWWEGGVACFKITCRFRCRVLYRV